MKLKDNQNEFANSEILNHTNKLKMSRLTLPKAIAACSLVKECLLHKYSTKTLFTAWHFAFQHEQERPPR